MAFPLSYATVVLSAMLLPASPVVRRAIVELFLVLLWPRSTGNSHLAIKEALARSGYVTRPTYLAAAGLAEV